jgi:hypothetical protein
MAKTARVFTIILGATLDEHPLRQPGAPEVL